MVLDLLDDHRGKKRIMTSNPYCIQKLSQNDAVLWCLILCVNLTGPWCSNISPNILGMRSYIARSWVKQAHFYNVSQLHLISWRSKLNKRLIPSETGEILQQMPSDLNCNVSSFLSLQGVQPPYRFWTIQPL